MKNFILISIIAVFAFATAQAQSVPFAYDKTVEWSKIDASMQKQLLGYANKAAALSPDKVFGDSLIQVVLVKGVPNPRPGAGHENQIWMKIMDSGKESNYLFSLSELPKIITENCKLTVNAKRGDSDEL